MTVASSIESVAEVSDLDRESMRSFICRIVSEPELRATFAADPAAAIDASGVVLSPVAIDALIRNHKAALDLTINMDDVTASFFFFALAH